MRILLASLVIILLILGITVPTLSGISFLQVVKADRSGQNGFPGSVIGPGSSASGGSGERLK
jgi:hypothetical protein